MFINIKLLIVLDYYWSHQSWSWCYGHVNACMLDGYGVYMYCLIIIVEWAEVFMHANAHNSIFWEGGNGPLILPLWILPWSLHRIR